MPIVAGEFQDHFTVEVAENKQYGKYILYVDLGEEVRVLIRYSKKGDKYPCKELTMEIGRITRRGCWRRTPKPKDLQSWNNKQGVGHCITFHDWKKDQDVHEFYIDYGTEVIVKIRRYTGNLSWGHWPELESYTEIGTVTPKGVWHGKRNQKEVKKWL